MVTQGTDWHAERHSCAAKSALAHKLLRRSHNPFSTADGERHEVPARPIPGPAAGHPAGKYRRGNAIDCQAQLDHAQPDGRAGRIDVRRARGRRGGDLWRLMDLHHRVRAGAGGVDRHQLLPARQERPQSVRPVPLHPAEPVPVDARLGASAADSDVAEPPSHDRPRERPERLRSEPEVRARDHGPARKGRRPRRATPGTTKTAAKTHRDRPRPPPDSNSKIGVRPPILDMFQNRWSDPVS